MITPVFYNNPENLSQHEIDRKLIYLYRSCISSRGTTENRDKRIVVLESYSSEIISKETYIKNFCS